MSKIKAFFISVGKFLKGMWKYPTTPIENFQDAKTSYYFMTDEECIRILEELNQNKDGDKHT